MNVVNLCVMKPNKNQVLLINRINSPYKGYWGLLGGKVKNREENPYAAVRELREECGLVRQAKSPHGYLSEQIYKVKNGLDAVFKEDIIYDFNIYFYRFFADEEIKIGKTLEGDLNWFNFNEISNLKIIPSDPWMIFACLGNGFRSLNSEIKEFGGNYLLHKLIIK